jgi:glycosyltransferase involved in cell wall biosynthesis
MEVLVAGWPVIAARCIGLREVVEGTPALTVDPRAPRDLAEAMRRVMRFPDACRAAAAAFMPEAGRRFDVRHASTGLDAVFERVRARGRKRTRLQPLTAR